MKKSIIFLSVITLLFSCSKKKEDTVVGVVVDTSVDLKVTNQAGEDLLNPETNGAYDHSHIWIYYLENGEVKLYEGGANMDHPRGFFIFDGPDNFKNIRIFLNSSEKESYPVTYVKWNETDMDTIKTHYKRTETLTVLDSIWYNGTLRWSFDMNVRHDLEIVK